ncbi:MAG: recombination protein RecR [Chloroflexi bacterium]|nr:recombination protein RecR [Chloroflexota bacterium]
MTSSDYLPPVGPVARLIEEFHKLPGIGPKSAQRLTYHLVRAPREEAQALAEAILRMVETARFCSRCQNITEHDPCALCADPRRDSSLLCVVEEPLDVLSLERSGAYKGLYHVLHGVLSPLDGVGPEQLKVRELLERLKAGSVKELILATNPSLEGEATALYLRSLVAPQGIRVTRLGQGLPSGGDLEYVDALTVARALEGRRDF